MKEDCESLCFPERFEYVIEKEEAYVIRQLQKNSEKYRVKLEEIRELERQYPFIAKLFDGDAVTEPMNMSVDEIKAISREYQLLSELRDMEEMWLYILGGMRRANREEVLELTMSDCISSLLK